jgi:hypothetical protein
MNDHTQLVALHFVDPIAGAAQTARPDSITSVFSMKTGSPGRSVARGLGTC